MGNPSHNCSAIWSLMLTCYPVLLAILSWLQPLAWRWQTDAWERGVFIGEASFKLGEGRTGDRGVSRRYVIRYDMALIWIVCICGQQRAI